MTTKRWGDYIWQDSHIGWILYQGEQAAAAIYDPDHPSNENRGPKWTARVRMGAHIQTVTLDPSLSLDEAKAVVQTLAGAQQ